MNRPALILLVLCLLGCSDDGWLPPDLPVGSSTPHLATTPAGKVVLSYLFSAPGGSGLAYVELGAQGWGPPQEVATGDDWFVNWADFPSVVPLTEERWAAHWLVRSAQERYAYDAVVAVSEDGGRRWSGPVTVHTDGTAAEHGFVSLYPVPEGVGVIWLDGRQLAVDPAGATALYSVAVALPELSPGAAAVVDDRVCDCCQTDVALAGGGPVAVYRDRSAEEIRDIAVSRWRAGRWETPRSVAVDGWKIDGCPVNGPAVAADGDQVVTAWYTANPERRIYVSFSDDGADTFSAPIDVEAGEALGRVDVVVVDSGAAVVSWLDPVPGSLRFRRVTAAGQLGPIREAAAMSPERNAGFPQMIRSGEWLVFAWTDVASNRVRTRRLPL